MQFRKVAVAGVLVLVVFGCVLAAGCTTYTSESYTTSSTTSFSASDGSITTTTNDNGKVTTTTTNIKDFIGYWQFDYDEEYAAGLKQEDPEFYAVLARNVDNVSDCTKVLHFNEDRTLEITYHDGISGEVVVRVTDKITWEPDTATRIHVTYDTGDEYYYDYDPETKTLVEEGYIPVYRKVA